MPDNSHEQLQNEVAELRAMVIRLAEANGLRANLENAMLEISSKLAPLKNLAPGPAELDDRQARALERIADALEAIAKRR